ncbi:IPT/TIG domain-containing protein [Streptomyces cirratus]|uniref:IPT/TIG domain-containing protein n=1 Tax=Streptomyces cirratus TaxID=68187 RepID=UPI0036183979
MSFPSNAPSTGPARGGRWIRRRDRGELNVKWFGAVGGGKADDTEHLVATIRAARTLATGVYLPAQNFKTTEEIRLETLPIPGANDIGLTIRGEGAVPPTGDRTRISAADTAMRSVISVDAGNVTIQGVTLHCSGAADHALYLQAAARLHLDDVQVFSAVKDGCRVAGRRDSGEPANSDNVYVREFNATVCGTMYCSPSLAHRYGNMRAIVPTAGSVSCKAGNQTITGTGTAFRSIPARPGDFIVVGDTDGSLQKLEIARIVDDATIEVDSLITPSTSLSGQPYAIGVGDGWSDALDVAAAGPLVPGDNSRARMDTGTFLSCAGSGIVSRSPYGPLLQHQEFQFCGFAGIVVGTLSGASALQFNTVISHAYFEGVFLGACVFVAQARGITIDQPMWAGQPAHRRLVFSTIAAHNAGIVGYVADINTTDSGASALHPIGDSTTTDIPALTSLNLKNTGTLIMPSGGAAVIIDRSPWTTRIPVTSRNLNFVADRGKIDSAADITATPTFPAGVDGQEIAVCNVSEHPLTFHDCRRGLPGTLGTGLVLDCAPGGSISLARGQIVEFYFSSTNSMSGLWTQRGPVSASAPVLVSLAGNAHAPGGDTMVVKGRNLDEASLVYIGSGTQKFGNITSTSSTSLTFTMPPMAAGTYNVLVTTGHGASNVLPLSVAN